MTRVGFVCTHAECGRPLSVVRMSAMLGGTWFYAMHNQDPQGGGIPAEHKPVVDEAALREWALEMEGELRGEARRLRRADKKAWATEKADTYAELARQGTRGNLWKNE